MNRELKRLEYAIYLMIILTICNMILTITVHKTTENNNKVEYDISMFKEIKIENIEDNVQTEDYKLLLMGKPNCEYTLKMIPIIKNAEENYKFETLYIDTRTITKNNKNYLLEYDDEVNFIDNYLGTTPFIIVFKNNKMIDTWVGYENYNVFTKFLENLGIEKKIIKNYCIFE